MMLIDAKGQGCPRPVLMAEEALAKIQEGTVEVLVDNEASSENVSRFAAKNGMHAETAAEPGQWRVKIVKGYTCATPGQEPQPSAAADAKIMLVIGTDVMGKEEELGRMLFRGFFETMKVTKEIPHTIFFLNAGVRLTTTNGETVPVLQELAAMGVEIFSCGTCLKYYGLEAELKVGYRGTTNHIVEGLKEFGKIVWI